ncbi:RNA pseudouridine synthase [Lachnospiraceae bacterium NSJ-143]|nr:RNA pseudouridine synthase [Lachnospiraceae bacterium NSJ-143]
METKILYNDNDMIAVEKPAGMPSQPDKTGDTDIKTVVEKYSGCECFIINRLDRPVGGAILFAKNKRTAAVLTDLLSSGGIKKYYCAVVCGRAEKSGKMEDYLIKNQRTNVSEVCSKDKKGAKKAALEFSSERYINDKTYGDLTFVLIKLLTGRHHQIRVQFASRGIPLWGDTKYNKLFYGKHGYFQTALWSYRLELFLNGNNIVIESGPQGEMFDKLVLKA